MHVDVNGTRLWFDVDGPALVPDGPAMRERPTVVLLHGGPGGFDHSYFLPDFARLAEVGQVVYLDLPGHGRSDWGDPHTWTFDFWADALHDFCKVLGIDKPVVFGHSLGSFVAMVHAVRHPGDAAGLVLQSAFARFDLDRIVEEFRRAGGDEVAAIARRSYGREGPPVTPEEWTRCWRVFGPWVPGDVERARTVVNTKMVAARPELIQRFDVLDDLVRVECPTLVCVGALDPITPVAAAREIVAALPDGIARLEIVEGAGHFPWRDNPGRFWPLLLDFVVECEPATSTEPAVVRQQ